MRGERKPLLLLGLFVVCGFPAAHAQSSAQDVRRAVLNRGNGWVKGVPGFGVNAFDALYGDYRLDPPDPAAPAAGDPSGGETPGFSVWVTRAPLYLDGEIWRNRPGISGSGARWRVAGERSFFAAALGSGGEGLTAVFEFPAVSDGRGGAEVPALPGDLVNRIVSNWVIRFNYFYALIKTPGDMSLPAVVAF
jgi:hypothetical protein